ncbi:MAG: arginine transporter [Octadecabacter sp.]|nr:arginine transporter [Octadecabacter sp.]
MKSFVILSALIVLTACSGGRERGSLGSTRGATGGISRSCLSADRSAATPALCECVQSVANSELSRRDRTRVADFFADPENANEMKTSDTTANGSFWKRYRAFTNSAGNRCG